MKFKLLRPVFFVIHQFGSQAALARAINKTPPTISKWKKPSCRGGNDGLIPSKAQIKILTVAAKMGIDIKAEDLILGRAVLGAKRLSK